MKHQLPKKRNLQRRSSRMKGTSSSEGNNTLLSSCTYLVCIISTYILYIYLLEDNVFQRRTIPMEEKQDKDCYHYTRM
jgi:hypothetical protein